MYVIASIDDGPAFEVAVRRGDEQYVKVGGHLWIGPNGGRRRVAIIEVKETSLGKVCLCCRQCPSCGCALPEKELVRDAFQT